MFGLLIILSIPLAISLAAFLDAAKRPQWVWAFCGRRQVLWISVILFAILSVVGGLLISSWYLLKVRPQLAAVEEGDVEGLA